MKKEKNPLSNKKSNANLTFMGKVVQSTKGFLKRYFPEKQKPQPLKEEIDETDWWKWSH